ncbi:hypothetical protein FGE12_22475 [Aggregicoccus sp. 17bor-14]|uniref:hypothetical protein n=1 Tax=Myxococcaceae TaxID=31 RepID=UPI00129C6111|nr:MULTISPECIES: hypothetical protein [Myxococcaceae]MBF5045187.1 hypothetical protein [Simulacricoccus sp. 17bor-14]MRI90928.1 hypothetical protein [Aggregicoccus sp. 17bor-14]
MSTPIKTPDWLLERIALGELPPEELARARAQLAQEPDGLARLAALEADNARVLERLPPAELAREVARRAHLQDVQRRAAPRRSALPFALGLPLAAALALLVVLSVREPAERGAGDSALAQADTTRIKGDPRLLVFRQGQGEPEQLRTGASARAGDLLQLGYVSAGHPYGAVLSLDGRGQVTLHFPERADAVPALDPKGAVSLGHAYELDDAPAFERFVLVTSDKPFDVQTVLEAARALARDPAQAHTLPLQLPAGLEQSSFTVEKPSR